MKKLLYNLFLLPLLMLVSSCAMDEPIVFDHENAVNEPKEGLILLEVIMPKTTLSEDVIYIAGAFNGGDEAAAGNSAWQLERSTASTGKWCIYLDPNEFLDGKTLADGFHFVSTMMGPEKTPLNKDVLRTDNPATGTMTNIYVSTWDAMFDVPAVHTGHYVIYVENKTSWEGELMLHDDSEHALLGEWPGKKSNGMERINGRKYTFFDMPVDLAGAQVKLVFNNGDGGSKVIDEIETLNRNLYITLTDTEVTKREDNKTSNLYVVKKSNWEEIALYAWADGKSDADDLLGSWPGTLFGDETLTINGVEYAKFAIPERMLGQPVNYIFNNNGAGEQAPDVHPIELRDYYYAINENKEAVEIVTTDLVAEEPVEIPFGLSMIGNFNAWSATENTIALTNEEGSLWTAKNVHFEGKDEFKFLVTDGSLMGALESNGNSAINANNPYPVYKPELEVAFETGSYNISIDLPGTYDVTYDKEANTITVKLVELDVVYGLYLIDKAGWSDLSCHYWTSDGFSTEWAGTSFTETREVNGMTYRYIQFDAAVYGKTIGAIVSGTEDRDANRAQVELTVDKDYYFILTEDKQLLDKVHIYVEDNSGWSDLSCHYWTDGFNTAWPGTAFTETKEVYGKTYRYIELDKAVLGKSLGAIISGTADRDGNRVEFSVTADKDHYYKLNADKTITEVNPAEGAQTYGLYVIDETGWDAIAVYAHGAVNNSVGGCPGTVLTEKKTVENVEYLYCEFPANVVGETQNLIFNNNGGGTQLADYVVTVDKDIFVKVTADGVTAIE